MVLIFLALVLVMAMVLLVFSVLVFVVMCWWCRLVLVFVVVLFWANCVHVRAGEQVGCPAMVQHKETCKKFLQGSDHDKYEFFMSVHSLDRLLHVSKHKNALTSFARLIIY